MSIENEFNGEREKSEREAREKAIIEFANVLLNKPLNREQAVDVLEQVQGKIEEHNRHFRQGRENDNAMLETVLAKIGCVVDGKQYTIYLKEISPGYELSFHTDPLDLLGETYKHLKGRI